MNGFLLLYHSEVERSDIPRLSHEWRDIIRTAIEKKLLENPVVYSKPLHRSLKGYRKLRVGDYRVIFRIEDMLIKIFIIQHRSIVYRTAKKRLV